MRVLAIGAGGVGTSAALIAKRRDHFGRRVIADGDSARFILCNMAIVESDRDKSSTLSSRSIKNST